MCKTEKLSVVSRKDGLKISVLYVSPEQECVNGSDGAARFVPKGIVQIVHGMSEYKERYLSFMEFLADLGYASIIHDHRGHGESVKSEDDYGYMYEVGTDEFLNDILEVNRLAKGKHSDVPLIMLGHSMGSLAARSLMAEHDTAVDGLILSGAPCKNPAVGAAVFLAKLQKKIFGGKHAAKFLETISFMSYIKRFAGEGSKYAWINSDPAAVAAYDADPACGFTFTVDGFQTLFELMERTFAEKRFRCRNPKLPILFIAGSEDPCIESREKFVEEVNFMKTVGYENVKSILYEGLRHEILNEPEKQKVFADVQRYLEKNFGGCR